MAMSSAEMAPNSYDCEDLEQLWCACAGPGVTIPQVGELVVYFPQGHLEQNQAGRLVPKHCFATSQSTRPSGSNPDARHPKSNVREQRSGLHVCKANNTLEGVPPQIICRVLNVELKASETGLVYAWMLLKPELLHDSELIDNKRLPPPMPKRHRAPYFYKELGAADKVNHAWLSIPRKDAVKCLPQLDMTQMAPKQVLVAKDLSGKEWRFQHTLVGRQMRHRLQTAEFATSNNLVEGDCIVILRGQDGDLRVGARRSMRQIRNDVPEMPNDEGCETGPGILQSISHAVTTGSKFTVLYNPTTGTDQFVVPCNRYYESINKRYYTGMRFRMISLRKAAKEDRLSGTISGIVDFDEAWPGSNWRRLKVKWDKESPVAIFNNVSPWEIEPDKRSSGRILPCTEMKRTRSQKGSQREYQRQKAEACLNKAETVLQLYHDESMKQRSSSVVENKKYLSAVDEPMDLSTGSSFSEPSAAADDVHKQAQAALDIEMSNLAKTFYALKLWNTNHFEDLDSSPHFQDTVIKINSLLALDGPCLSSTSSEPTSLSSNSTNVSSRDSDLMPAEDCTILHNVISCLEEKKVDLINAKSVKVIASIASRMIKAGYKERLRETFTDLSKELIRDFRVLDFSWNFRGHWKVDEGDSWHGEDISLQYWNSASQLITRVLLEMQRQLNEQNFGAFDELKGDYFAKIVEQPILKLLNDASMSAALGRLLQEVPHGSVKCMSSIFLRIGHVLSTHKTLSDVVPTLLELVSPECRGSLSVKTESIRESVEEVVIRMLYTLTNVMSSSVLSQTEGSDIHPVARVVVKGIGLMSQHRETLNLILARNCCQTLEGVCNTKSFACLISNLMMHLGSALEQSSKIMVNRELQYIFLSNNLQFVLQQVKNTVPKEPIGYDWVVRYQEQIEQYVEEYIETSWAPLSSHLAGMDGKHFSFLKPSCVHQFTTAFQSVYDIQRHWKVPDPLLREKLRVSVSKKIVPSYSEYLKKHLKDERSVRITANGLKDLLAQLFEG